MTNYQEVRVKLTNSQLNKLKSAVKNKTGAALRINKKNFQGEELPHELFLTPRQMLYLTIYQRIEHLVKLKYLKESKQVELLVLG